MTSKNLFFKLMKEDIKRRVWAIGLAFLSFFLWMPVAGAMEVSNLQKRYQNWVLNALPTDSMTPEMRYLDNLTEAAKDLVGVLNPMNITSICVASIVLALTGFLYLHSKKQMDFYHSIPVKREVIFAAKYVNGFLIIAGTYLTNMILAMGVFAVNGMPIGELVPMGLTAFLVHMGGFLINYGLMAVAVMLTGNFFVSILGGMVLFAYLPAIIGLMIGMMELFFVTMNFRGLELENLLYKTTPIAYYIMRVTEMSDSRLTAAELTSMQFSFIGISMVVGLVMALVAMFLYKKRPSESAGKAMAFRISRAPIKILIVTPMTIAVAILFWNIYYSLPWAIFGFVFGLVITHSIIEIIYHFEFRKLFANLPQMGISAVAALMIIAVFRYDLIRYDSFMPSENNFEYASVMAYGLDDWNDYGLPYKLENKDDYNWNYMSHADYAANNMKITDYEIIRSLTEAGIMTAEHEKECKYSGREIYQERNMEHLWTNTEIVFHMKNGKTVARNYYLDVTALRETFDKMYASKEYKEGIYPVMALKAENLSGVYESMYNEILEVTTEPVAIAELLETYKEELTALTLAEREKEIPVTSLRFLTLEEEQYLKYVTASRKDNYTGDFMIEDMNKVNFFPVYPSFTKTLALLEEAGIDHVGRMELDNVLRIEIQSYLEAKEDATFIESVDGKVTTVNTVDTIYPQAVSYENGYRTFTLENDGTPEMTACIEEVLKSAKFSRLAQMNNLCEMEYDIEIFVYLKDVNEGRLISNQESLLFQFPVDEVPEFLYN